MGCRGHFGPQAQFSGWNTEQSEPNSLLALVTIVLNGLNIKSHSSNALTPHNTVQQREAVQGK